MRYSILHTMDGISWTAYANNKYFEITSTPGNDYNMTLENPPTATAVRLAFDYNLGSSSPCLKAEVYILNPYIPIQ